MSSAEFLRILCQSERYLLHLPLSTSILDLKSLISARHHLASGVRLVFRDHFLDSSSTLLLSGVPSGSLIVALPLKPDITVRIVPRTSPPFNIPISLHSPVSDLRCSIALHLKLHPDQLHLVHFGHLLQDPFSLSYYELADQATVYVLLVKQPALSRARPSQLIADLRTAIAQFVSASPAHQRRLRSEVTGFLSNPVLQAFAKIDPKARMVLEDARALLEDAENPITAHQNLMIAIMNDRTMTQFETTAQGMRLLLEAVMKRNAKKSQPAVVMPTKIEFEAKIAEEPLPIWWSAWGAADGERFVRMGKGGGGERQVGIKERFSREIRALKMMGFADESVILMALKETSGNVHRAAKLLMRSVTKKCA